MQAVSALSLAGDALGRQRQMRAGDGNYKVTEANHQRLDKARSKNRVAADRAEAKQVQRLQRMSASPSASGTKGCLINTYA